MPPRPWRENEAKESHATKTLHAVGGRGVDVRSDASASIDDLVLGTVDAIRIRGEVKYESLRACAIGAALDAMKRGWNANNFTPYYAANFLYYALIDVVQGTYPTIQSAPEWFWELTAALHPKTAPFKTGSIQTSWALTGNNTFPSIVDFGNRHLVFGAPGVGDVNGYPILDIAPAYDPAFGAAAIAEMFKMYPDAGLTSQKSIAYDDTMMFGDTSAFATVYAEIGSAATTIGGIANTIQSERKIECPVFSHFANYQEGPVWRGFQEYRKDAGSPMSVVPRMIAGKSKGALKNKISPIYKFIDFDEIYEQMSLTLASAMELGAASQIGAPPAACTLSFQDVQLCLRQALIGAFSNEYGCDLEYTSPAAVDFLPMSCASNGIDYSLSNDGTFLIPQFLAENIRALTKKVCFIKGRGKTQRLDVIPILGRYDVPQLQNYSYSLPDGSTLPLYLPLAILPDPETPINLVECSAVIPAGTVYLDLNGSTLQKMSSKWNQWITGLANYLSPLTSVGREHGINALGNLFCTTHSLFVPTLPNLEQPTNTALTLGKATSQAATGVLRKNSKVNSGSRHFGRTVEKSGYGLPAPDANSTFYQSIQPSVVTSMLPLYKAVWNVQKLMIFPTYIGDATLTADGTVSAQQVFQVEPYSVPINLNLQNGSGITTDTGGDTLFLRHLEAAKMDIRSPLQPLTETMQNFNALTQTARGGFFTALAGNFLEAVGVKGAKNVADAIGNATGW